MKNEKRIWMKFVIEKCAKIDEEWQRWTMEGIEQLNQERIRTFEKLDNHKSEGIL